MALSKLESLLKSEIYVRPENMEQNVGYEVEKMSFTVSRFNKQKNSILTELKLSETVTGAYYLPYKYLEHPKFKLNAADVTEINSKIGGGGEDKFYIVHQGYTLGQPIINLIHASPSKPFSFRIYNGLDADQNPNGKRTRDATDTTEDDGVSYSKYSKNN